MFSVFNLYFVQKIKWSWLQLWQQGFQYEFLLKKKNNRRYENLKGVFWLTLQSPYQSYLFQNNFIASSLLIFHFHVKPPHISQITKEVHVCVLFISWVFFTFQNSQFQLGLNIIPSHSRDQCKWIRRSMYIEKV